MLTLHRPTLSLTGFAISLIEFSICNFKQLANYHLTIHIHKYTHLPSPDTVSDRVCRWLDRVFSLPILAVSYLRLTIHKYTHLPSNDYCIWQGLLLARSSLFSATLKRYLNSDLTIHKYSHLPSPDAVSDRACRWLDRVFSLQFSLLSINNPQIYSLAIAR